MTCRNVSIADGLFFIFNNPPIELFETKLEFSYALVDVNVTETGEVLTHTKKYSFKVEFSATDLSFLNDQKVDESRIEIR